MSNSTRNKKNNKKYIQLEREGKQCVQPCVCQNIAAEHMRRRENFACQRLKMFIVTESYWAMDSIWVKSGGLSWTHILFRRSWHLHKGRKLKDVAYKWTSDKIQDFFVSNLVQKPPRSSMPEATYPDFDSCESNRINCSIECIINGVSIDLIKWWWWWQSINVQFTLSNQFHWFTLHANRIVRVLVAANLLYILIHFTPLPVSHRLIFNANIDLYVISYISYVRHLCVCVCTLCYARHVHRMHVVTCSQIERK